LAPNQTTIHQYVKVDAFWLISPLNNKTSTLHAIAEINLISPLKLDENIPVHTVLQINLGYSH
jgi:hypothetical protein